MSRGRRELRDRALIAYYRAPHSLRETADLFDGFKKTSADA